MTEPEFNRAQRTLNKFVADKLIKPSSRDWFIDTIDPFHDTVLPELQGWPDLEDGMSVVRKIKQSQSVASPFGSGVSWDMHVVMWPFPDTQPYNTLTSRRNNTGEYSGLGPFYPLGGVQVYASLAGVSLDLNTAVLLQSFTLQSPYTDGIGRLTALAFEVEDTTAVLNRQGSALVYCQNQRSAHNPQAFVFRNTTANNYNIASCLPFHMPPPNAQVAMLIPGTKQWKSEEGAYVVARFHSSDNPPAVPGYDIPILFNRDDAVAVVNADVINVPVPAIVATFSGFESFNAMRTYDIHQSGAMFLALNPLSTFNIRVNWTWETFPVPPTENDILVLATPSAPYDPFILELMARALSSMPPGVPVRFNNFGTWFSGVIDSVSSALAVIPHPIAQGLSMAGKAVAPMIRSVSAPSRTVEEDEAEEVEKMPKKKRKRVKVNNLQLAAGSRGTKGNIQGPMRR